MSIADRQQRVREIADALERVAASNEIADVLAIKIKTLLAELASTLSGFPNGPLLKRMTEALAAHTDLILMQCDRASPGVGPSHRQALQEFARSLAASFGGASP